MLVNLFVVDDPSEEKKFGKGETKKCRIAEVRRWVRIDSAPVATFFSGSLINLTR